MSKIQFQPQAAIVEPNTSLEEFTEYLELCLNIQRDILWQIGDISRAMEHQHPNTFHQGYPVKVSPDLISRCQAVSAAYRIPERNIDATWTVHMQLSKRPDRVAAVAASVDAGQTSDEARKNPPPPQVEEPKSDPVPEAVPADKQRWLLAVDVNYFIHTYFHSGAGVESASTFVEWLTRLVARLQETKGLTDVVCCFDSTTNHRKALTETWEHKYKPRSEKEPELIAQLNLVQRLLKEVNLPVVSLPDMEADDVMASYSKQFDGKVTLLTGDKDMRQCLSTSCNILQSVTWEENSETGKMVPTYQWIKERWSEKDKKRWEEHPEEKPDNVKSHFDDGSTYNSTKIVGVSAEQWPHFQVLVGDSTDGIKGCQGIGAKGAMELIKAHGTVQGVIAACKDNKADLSEKKRLDVLDFEEVSETMLKLTTLRTDLPVPQTTRISMKAD